VIRRLGANGSQLALLSLLALTAALLVTGAPRVANRYVDESLRERIDSYAYQVRDLTYEMRANPFAPTFRPVESSIQLAVLHNGLEPELQRLVSDQWTGMRVDGEVSITEGLPEDRPFALSRLGLRSTSGATASATLTAGVWPKLDYGAGALVEAALSVPVAEAFALDVGDRFLLRAPANGVAITVVITGIFTPNDPDAPIWADEPELLEPLVPIGQDGVPAEGMLLVEPSGVNAALTAGMPATYSWRFRIDAQGLDASRLEAITTAVTEARYQDRVPFTFLTTSLDGVLARFTGEVRAVQALLAIVQAGLVATLFGLVLLAARTAVDRRFAELSLLRARGAAVATIGQRLVAESALLVPAAVAAGWGLGKLAPGRPGGADWLAVVFGAATIAAVPVLAMASQWRFAVTARARLDGRRRSLRRVTAEVSVLVLAGLGAFLLRRRGLNQDSGVDPFLVSVPVLLAAGAALLGLRAFAWPMRLAGRLAARARGAVPFLGLARAGRGTASVWPLAVLVISVSAGVFSAVTATTIADGRDRATTLAVPADAVLRGFLYSPRTPSSLADVPGVTSVAALSANPGSPLLTGPGLDARELNQTLAVAVDGPALARVVADSGRRVDLPALVTAATRTGAAVPAVVSPAVADDIGERGAVVLQGQLYEFTVAEVAEGFPTLGLDLGRFVILPLQALPQPETKPVLPTGFLVAGEGMDLDALTARADDGQREWVASVTGAEVDQVRTPTTITTWTAHRASLERTGVNQVLSFTFLIGAAGGTALALIAVGFAVAAEARTRGRALSRLRTMGLSQGQGRRLLAYELLPLVGVGAVAGTLVGAALPRLIGPALGLSNFTGGVPAQVRLDPAVMGVTAALVVVAIAAALMIEAAINRRLRLGDVLRLGEET
jgi:putative ABC transport system permease protein